MSFTAQAYEQSKEKGEASSGPYGLDLIFFFDVFFAVVLRFVLLFGDGVLLKNSTPRGGSVIEMEWSLPCEGTLEASTRPALPHPLPPYISESLFRTSFQTPPRGTPTT